MTEPHIEKAARAWLDTRFDSSPHVAARRVLIAAFAELAANPPEEAVKANGLAWAKSAGDEKDSQHLADWTEDGRAGLSAAFSALREDAGVE